MAPPDCYLDLFLILYQEKSESTETAMLSIASMKSYRGMCTIQLQYIKFNFHFCPTCLKALCYAENSLSRSRVKVKVVCWWWRNVNELHICHMEVEETIQMLRNHCTKISAKTCEL